MTKARTYFTSSVEGRGFFTALLIAFMAITGVQAQCTLELYLNGSNVSGQTSFVRTLGPGDCAADLSVELVISGSAQPACTPSSTTINFGDGTSQFISSVTNATASFPIGTNTIDFDYLDFDGLPASYPTITLTINPYPNPITALACNDNIQVSLNQDCEATVTADMVLEGGPYRCYDDYVVEIEDALGNLIDRDPNTPGVQLDGNDFGNCYTSRVVDPATGNSCWGEICVEDKLDPVLDCRSAPIVVDCGDDISPDAIGRPGVTEACGSATLTFVDIVDERGCGDQNGLDRVIFRTWTATDLSGNTATCTEEIWVQLGDLGMLSLPPNYDDVDEPALECDEKYDANKDISAHILNIPLCVDGYLLDSAEWIATGGDPNLGDLSGVRMPKVLGWNCIQSGPYAGHPSPEPIYYEPHPQWQIFGVCWGPDEKVQWAGTGYPTGVECSNINYTFSDIRIDLGDPNCSGGDVGCYKILRKWTLLDWCTGEVREEFQVIKVLDKKGPTITYPDAVEVGMVSHSCYGVWTVTPPWIEDNCSEEVSYDLRVSAGTVLGNHTSGFTVIDLPEGTHTAVITAYDCCGTQSEHEVKITVVDNVPPVAICDDRTIVSLSGNPATGLDYSKLCAQSLDNGSYDNCADVYFKVIRMDALLGTVNGSFATNDVACGGADGDDDALISGNQVYYDDCATFCCADIGEPVMVVLRVFDVDPGAGPVNPTRMSPTGDLNGHFTDCMVEVEVQDKSNPVVVAPPDIVISCMFWFDDSEDALTDPDNPIFGRVVTDLGSREKVKTLDKVCEEFCESNAITGYDPSSVQGGLACDFYDDLYDPAHPDDKYELVWGFDGYVLSTCGTDFTIRVDDRRECGQGLIIRDVIVTRGNTTFRDRQEIWVVDCDPFYINENECLDPDDHIVWPLNCVQPPELEGCGNSDTSPDNPQLGRPELVNGGDDNCALIIVDYKDEVYTVEPDACYKIIRTWIVIDWCQYDPARGGRDGRWEYVQIIKVQDREDPVVNCEIGPCEPAEKDANGICFGHIELTVDADDECTPDNWLNYEYKIDLNNDGTYDAFSGPAKPGSAAFNYDNPYADDAKNSTDASGTYPIGVHRISWFIEDGCGNVGTCDTVFVVEDCKQPTPYCKTGIITVVMPSSGSIEVWASDLDAGSFDNCSDAADLKFYFNGDSKWTAYEVNCDTFQNRGATGEVMIEVEVWVEDEEGNADFCRTTIRVQDPNGICGTTSNLVAVAGKVYTEDARFVEEVAVDLNMAGQKLGDRRTSADGYYAFMGLTMGADYEVTPKRDDDYLNGVSTKDLVKIQRHLLGLEVLDSPYKIIAADANGSDDISAADISTLRKLILGVDAELDDVDSWRFVDSDWSFEDPRNPWHPFDFPENIIYNDMDQEHMTSDFIAIKVGDVTNDAYVDGAISNGTRSNEVFVISADNAVFEAGETVEVTLSAGEAQMLSGYQFTMTYTDQLSLIEVNAQQEGLGEGNFAILEEGVLTSSWNDFGGVKVEGELFTLVFEATASGSLGDALSINSNETPAEAYDQDLNTMSVQLNVGGTVVAGGFELYQNVPNPFADETVIGFELPQPMEAMITVYDVMGKVVRIIEVDGNRGYNEVSVQKSDLDATGILYYQLDAGAHSSTRKMILMN